MVVGNTPVILTPLDGGTDADNNNAFYLNAQNGVFVKGRFRAPSVNPKIDVSLRSNCVN